MPTVRLKSSLPVKGSVGVHEVLSDEIDAEIAHASFVVVTRRKKSAHGSGKANQI